MGGSDRSALIFLISILGSTSAYYVSETIIFPMRYVDRSIDFGISSDELNAPTGKCEKTRDRYGDLSLILPRTCAPRVLYSGFISSDRVGCLSLRESQIEEMPYGSFDSLPNLYYLDLAKNHIQFCDILSFGGHPSLRTLIVDENAASVVMNGLPIDRADYFPRLEHLYLRKNYLSALRLSIGRYFPALTHLYLSDNLLTSESLNNDLRDLPNSLSHLHLERNTIGRVDSRIVRNLRFLFLEGNRIRSICSFDCLDSCINLRDAEKLWFLSLPRNEIASIDRDSFADTWNLRSLNLAHNRLESIPIGAFDRLRILEDLSLSHNRLSHVPDLSQLRMLTGLTIDHNNIEIISSGTFRNLDRLKWLSLSGNRLRTIDAGAFSNVPALEELDLSDNELDYLPPNWIDCPTHLRLLDLRSNRFSNYDHLHLRDLTALTDIYVQDNPLTRLDSPKFHTFTRDVTVHSEYGVTYATRPCYVTCDLNHHPRDYWV